MKVLLGSDYHCDEALENQALALIEDVDWYVNCGDYCNWAGRQPEANRSGFHPHGETELKKLQHFWRRIDASGTPWLFLPGNHEPPAETLGSLYMESNLVNGMLVRETQLVEIASMRVLLVPWTPPCGWCWSLSREHLKELTEKYRGIEVDILISHAPPKGLLDEGGKWYRGKTPTLAPLLQVVAPKYYLCGHMHLDGGKIKTKQGTTFINAARHNLLIEL